MLLPFATTYHVVVNGISIIIWIFFSNVIPADCESTGNNSAQMVGSIAFFLASM